MTRMTELSVVMLDKSGGLVYNDNTYPKPQPAEGRVHRKEGSSMEALKSFFWNAKDLLTLLGAIAAVAGITFLFVRNANRLDDMPEGEGVWPALRCQFLALVIGAVCLFLWETFIV